VSFAAADARYEAIRKSATDVQEIATQTGWRVSNIARVKRHLFEQIHWLDLYEELGVPGQWGRFDSSSEIADAWERLRIGSHSADDLQLLRQETAESWFMRKHGPSYLRAHQAARRRYPWPLASK
jgi:hypothetical protein